MRFSKMHGAGNDFVVLDLRHGQSAPDADVSTRLSDRHFGVGCDQILTIEAPRRSASVASYRIWNADGSPSQQCGNGARCVAAWLVREGSAQGEHFALDSPLATHTVQRLADGAYAVAMGVPQFDPAHIPLSGFERAQPAYDIALGGEPLSFGAVSMGNPHAVIEVADIAAAPLDHIAPALQASAAFPEAVNVGFVQVIDRGHVRLRVHERGVGETQACGSGACAAAAVLMRAGRVDRSLRVSLPGGDLQVCWPGDGEEVIMAGPTAFVFEGEWQR